MTRPVEYLVDTLLDWHCPPREQHEGCRIYFDECSLRREVGGYPAGKVEGSVMLEFLPRDAGGTTLTIFDDGGAVEVRVYIRLR